MREKTEALRSKLTSALIYPIVLFLTAIGAVVVLLTVVVPRMEPMFAQAGAALPASTQRRAGGHRSPARAGLSAAGPGRRCSCCWASGCCAARARGAPSTPGCCACRSWGSSMRDRITAQLCRALATCLGGGLDLPAALVVSRDVLGNLHARAAMDEVVTRVRTGRTVADSLTAADIMTPLAVKMLRVGEESGRLQPVAAHLAETFEDRVATRLQRLVAVIEPATVIVLGLVVGGIVMSILTAVLSVNELAL